MTIQELIDFYLFNAISSTHLDLARKPGCCTMVEEMNEIRKLYINGLPMDQVIEKCVCNRHGHQYCIPDKAVEDAVAALTDPRLTVAVDSIKIEPFINGRDFASFSDFEELYDFIKQVIGPISGIGPLTVYDTARRIGHLLKDPIYPKQYVYLAAGALVGAKSLLGVKRLKFREPIGLFTPHFGTLTSVFIEDMLCIFKNEFASGLASVSIPNAITSSTAAFGSHNVTVPVI